MSYWASKARVAASLAYDEGVMMGLEGKDLERHVRAAYPFGEYDPSRDKLWNQAVRRLFPKSERMSHRREVES